MAPREPAQRTSRGYYFTASGTSLQRLVTGLPAAYVAKLRDGRSSRISRRARSCSLHRWNSGSCCPDISVRPPHPGANMRALDKMSGGRQVFFKCEVFQKTGSFKARGACNAVLLAPSECQDIVTHSSGNHAQVRTSKYVLTKILPGTWYVHKTKRYSTTLWLFYLPDFYFANQRSSQCNSSTYGQNDILVVLVCIQNMVRIVLVYGARCTSYVHIIRYRSRI